MRAPLGLILCSVNLAFATWHKPLPGHRSLAGLDDGLIARQMTVDPGSNCTEESTCSECYGAGNVLCSNAGCFDPSQGQQCCADGSYCTGSSNSCCPNGPGTTGTDGVVPQTAYSAFYSATTQWPCFPTDTNEQCCHRGGAQWCSGDYPAQVCYDPSSVLCCSNGKVCTGNGCCSSLGAVATTPNPSLATRTGTPTPTGTSGKSTSHATTAESTSSSGTAATATATKASNAGSELGNVKGGVGMVGAFLVGLIFL